MNVPEVNIFQSCSNGPGPLHIGAAKGQKENISANFKNLLIKIHWPDLLIFLGQLSAKIVQIIPIHQ